jgi:hypothetical protein
MIDKGVAPFQVTRFSTGSTVFASLAGVVKEKISCFILKSELRTGVIGNGRVPLTQKLPAVRDLEDDKHNSK